MQSPDVLMEAFVHLHIRSFPSSHQNAVCKVIIPSAPPVWQTAQDRSSSLLLSGIIWELRDDDDDDGGLWGAVHL